MSLSGIGSQSLIQSMNAVNDKTGVYGENIFTFSVYTNRRGGKPLK